MQRYPVTSSNIQSVGFDNGTLEVEFKSGAVYAYTDVPEHVYTGLIGAASVGKYLNREIVGKYEHTKIQ